MLGVAGHGLVEQGQGLLGQRGGEPAAGLAGQGQDHAEGVGKGGLVGLAGQGSGQIGH